MPTLVICGDRGPYLNCDLVNARLESLPEIIPGISHMAHVERPCYRCFQERLMEFLNCDDSGDAASSETP